MGTDERNKTQHDKTTSLSLVASLCICETRFLESKNTFPEPEIK